MGLMDVHRVIRMGILWSMYDLRLKLDGAIC